jgi:muconate cycloisomerase
LYRFRDCKVKVGAQGDDDLTRLRTIRRWIGAGMDLRLDANEAWHADEFLARVGSFRQFNISCIEQPVPHAEVGALAAIREHAGVLVMLDESLTSATDARSAIAEKTCDLFNIRLSKCGGYLASLRLAAMAQEAGLGYQLGCHPGETGVLSAAGRHWACAVANIRYLEGSYDRHVFSCPLTNEDMTFGFGGRAPAIGRAGLGVTMNETAMQKATVSRQTFQVV